MDFALTEEQQAVLEAVDQLLARHAGPARAVALTEQGGADEPLFAALVEAGFAGIVSGEGTGTLEAALIVERVARAAGTTPAAASILVAPALCGAEVPGPVALATVDEAGPVRFAPGARTLLVLDCDEVRRVALEAGDVKPVASNFGFPFGRVREEARRRGEPVGAGAGPTLSAWWRIGLAAEALGAMQAALDYTVAYLREREQFAQPIGAFQAVQHRLADCAVRIEGTRWLVYEAAAGEPSPEAAATVASYAALAAGQVHRETHQLSGAIGYTTEHDLHVWSMRLQALRLELGGASAHLRALARARWNAPS